MASGPDDICNVALLRVGHRQPIGALDEPSTEAELCNVLYAPARDAVLEDFDWSCARRRATLALTTETRDDWDFVYALPSDCLAPRKLVTELRNPSPGENPPFKIELNDAGDAKVLLTDQEDAVLHYTAASVSEGLWSPLFCDALAWRLAVDLAMALPVKPQVGLAMKAGYQQALYNAMASDLRQATEDEQPESQFIRERG